MGKFDDLPKEIVLEILSKLPTEDVLDCKLVCNPWKDLIRLPYFSQKHLNHLNYAGEDSGKSSFVIFHRVNNDFSYNEYDENSDDFSYDEYDENSDETPFSRKARLNLNLPFYEYDHGYLFAGSCNGLIFLESWHEDNYVPSYIFNPITREYIILPWSEGWYSWSGFGYIPSTNEYKVVRVYNSETRGKFHYPRVHVQVQVYTLGSNTGWRNLEKMDRSIRTIYSTKIAGAFANGALHWGLDDGTILAFHVTDEMFSKLRSPPRFTRNMSASFSISLRVLGDFLSAYYYDDAHRSGIWLLKKNATDYNDLSWSKEFSFESGTLQDSPVFGIKAFGYTKSGRLLCYNHYKIDGYLPKARIIGVIDKSFYDAIPHKNTLVSLKALGEKDAKISNQ